MSVKWQEEYAIGIGVILVGLNLARYWKGQPTNGFTTILGILALLRIAPLAVDQG